MKKRPFKIPPLPKGKLTKQKLLIFIIMLVASFVISQQDPKPSFDPNNPSLHTKIIKVSDGDTVKTEDGQTIRLLGLDAPELAKTKNNTTSEPGGYYSQEAKKLLEQLVLGKVVYLAPEKPIYDNYQRRVAELITDNSESVNEQMLERGAALLYQFSNLSNEQNFRFLEAQRKAIDAKRGFWQKILKQKQSSMPAIANKRSKRFFPESCDEAKKVAENNKIYFKTALEALKDGYSPSRECNFWPNE